MKLRLFLILSMLSVTAYAAETQPKEPPAQPGAAQQGARETEAPDDGEQVTITRKKDTTIEEYRVNGRLYMIKVTPKRGKPYYLIDDKGDGHYVRHSTPGSNVHVPQWVIKRF